MSFYGWRIGRSIRADERDHSPFSSARDLFRTRCALVKTTGFCRFPRTRLFHSADRISDHLYRLRALLLWFAAVPALRFVLLYVV
jgi:hypothetical protein